VDGDTPKRRVGRRGVDEAADVRDRLIGEQHGAPKDRAPIGERALPLWRGEEDGARQGRDGLGAPEVDGPLAAGWNVRRDAEESATGHLAPPPADDRDVCPLRRRWWWGVGD